MQWEWHLTTEKAWPVQGEPGSKQPHGGLTFFLDLKSPARRGATSPASRRFPPAQNKERPLVEGFSYLNPRIEQLWRKTSGDPLSRVNPHTGLALKDDPAVAGIMIWNENDLTGHFGLLFLGGKSTPWHRKLYLQKQDAFCARTGLKPSELDATWLEQDDFFTWAEEHIVHRNVYTKPTRGANSLAHCDRELGYSAIADCPVKPCCRAITLAMA